MDNNIDIACRLWFPVHRSLMNAHAGVYLSYLIY